MSVELISPVQNVVFSQKAARLHNLQNPQTFFQTDLPPIVGVDVFQKIIDDPQNKQNLAILVEQQKAAHAAEVIKGIDIQSQPTDEYLLNDIG